LVSVKLKEGFLGNCGSYLPQYFINAILLGASQVVVYLIGVAVLAIKGVVSIETQRYSLI
jgi:uncharacterized membrane protein (Fun14 family)